MRYKDLKDHIKNMQKSKYERDVQARRNKDLAGLSPCASCHHTAATSALLTPVFVLHFLAVFASALHILLFSLSPRLLPPSRA